MRAFIGLDKFRGTITAAEAVRAVAQAAEAAGWECEEAPLADGGEGTLDVLGGANRTTVVSGPLGDPVEARWQYRRGRAVIEMATASGLDLVGGADGNDAVAASTYGTGELIAASLDAGARRIIVGLGGSATTDGGLGALRAMEPVGRLKSVRIDVACDVRTTFLDAAPTFAPQKGASEAEVALLRGRLERTAQLYEEVHGLDVRSIEGSGAAGGLAGGLAAVGGVLVPGFELIADELDVFGRMEECDALVTGEGLLDPQSFDGKVVGETLALARELDLPALVIVGDVAPDLDPATASGASVVSLTERFGRDRSRRDTAACLAEVAGQWFGARA